MNTPQTFHSLSRLTMMLGVSVSAIDAALLTMKISPALWLDEKRYYSDDAVRALLEVFPREVYANG